MKTKEETLPTDNKEDKDENPISAGSEYSSKSEFSKARVILEAIQKCFNARAKEMIPGYFDKKFDQLGVPHMVWTSDQREVFNSSVEGLKSLLAPEIENSEDYKAGSKAIEKKKKELFEKYCYTELKPETNEQHRVIFTPTKNKYMPYKDEKVLITQITPDGRISIKDIVGGWNRRVDFYIDGMVKLNDELFSGMNQLIDSLNYFKSGRKF